jgi:hypothetical protein
MTPLRLDDDISEPDGTSDYAERLDMRFVYDIIHQAVAHSSKKRKGYLPLPRHPLWDQGLTLRLNGDRSVHFPTRGRSFRDDRELAGPNRGS